MNYVKLFKNKITYFDLILGVAFLAVALGIYLFFYRKTEYVNIRVKVTDSDVLYANTDPQSWYANRFDVGDTESDQFGRPISQIVGVVTFNTSDSTKAVYLDIKVKAVYDRRTKLYSARGTNLVFGGTLRFNFSKVTFNGLITESPSTISQKDLKIEERTVTVLKRGPQLVEPEVLEKIQKGDTITDSQGNTLAEVTNVVLRPGQRETVTASGDILLREDPYFKDAIITLKVRVKIYKGDAFIFDDLPLKLGSICPLNFSYESIYPTIVGIQ